MLEPPMLTMDHAREEQASSAAGEPARRATSRLSSCTRRQTSAQCDKLPTVVGRTKLTTLATVDRR